MLETAVARGLCVLNTRFQKKKEHLVTFEGTAGKSHIDLILVETECVREFRDCKVIPSEDLESQHMLLLMIWKFKAASASESNLRVTTEGLY